MNEQITLFDDTQKILNTLVEQRSGSFTDNMSLPIHRWFRYSAGFSAQWVEKVLKDWNIKTNEVVLDPFVGSGTVPLVCDSLKIKSVGIDAHPFVYRVCKCKTLWTCSPEKLKTLSINVQNYASKLDSKTEDYPILIRNSFDPKALKELTNLKLAWVAMQKNTPESELIWLAISIILRVTATAGTAQWQYILPNKQKKNTTSPYNAFNKCVEMMYDDIKWMQMKVKKSRALIINGDARKFENQMDEKVTAVITSPPYANNYDYADALRFEMTFWGEVACWGDIHDAVRKYLIVSSSQHASKDKLELDEILKSDVLYPIIDELSSVVHELSIVRLEHGGKKHYHTMVAAYCRDIGLVMRELRKACIPNSKMCWVIGDSAPYGVYCHIDKWIGEMALSEGFTDYRFEKLRDRNIKWKNRKHRVPLKEGLLWIEG